MARKRLIVVPVRMTRAEHLAMKRAAKASGRNQQQFLRDAIKKEQDRG